MDILDFLRSLREPYENNLPSGGAPRRPRLPAGPAMTKGDVEADLATRRAAGTLEQDLHAYTPEVEDNPQGAFMGGRDRLRAARTALEKRRAQAQDEIEGRKYPGEEMIGRLRARFKGTTPGSPEFFARATGEDPSTMIHPEEGTPMPARGALAAGPYEDTELRRGVPAVPRGRGALGRPADFPRESPDKARQRAATAIRLIENELEEAQRNGDMEAVAAREAELKRLRPMAGDAVAVQAGALDADPWESAMGETSQQNAALGAVGALGGGEQAAAGPTAAPREALADAFRRKVAEIEKDTGEKLTDQQKAELQLDFFLRLMSAGTKRGATLLGAAGESGLATSALSRGMRDKNMASARQKRTEAREDVFREVGFSDKDADNERLDRRTETEERRWNAAEERDKERLRLEWKKLEAEGARPTGTQILANGNIAIVTKTGVIDTGAKARTPASEIDPIERLLKTLEKRFPKDTPEQIWQRAVGLKRDTTKGEISEDEWLKATTEHNKGIVMAGGKPLTVQEYKRLMSGAAETGPQRFNTPAELEAAVKTGKVKKGDRVITPRGERIVK